MGGFLSELVPSPTVLTGADAYMGQIWQMFNYGGWTCERVDVWAGGFTCACLCAGRLLLRTTTPCLPGC